MFTESAHLQFISHLIDIEHFQLSQKLGGVSSGFTFLCRPYCLQDTSLTEVALDAEVKARVPSCKHVTNATSSDQVSAIAYMEQEDMLNVVQ